MRGSLLLLAALATLAACSDSSGPRHVPTLTTQLSASVDTIGGGALTVTLTASNPTDTTIHLSFTTAPVVLAQVKVNGQWTNGVDFGDGFTGTDTLSLTSGANAPLGTMGVIFSSQASHLSLAPAMGFPYEQFALSPATYSVRACFFPTESTSPQGGITQAVCGNGVSFTLVQ